MATAPRKKRTKKKSVEAYAAGGDVIDIPEPEAPEETSGIRVDPLTGAVEIDHDDGSITIDPTGASLWNPDDDGDDSFGANLAEKIDPVELGRVSEDLLMKVDTDKQGRSQWEQMRAKTVELLGLKLEDPKGDVSRSALGMSTSVVRDPTLLQAVEFFRANAYGELCPSTGPVKVKINGKEQTNEDKDLADTLADDLNYYLTTSAPEYYPDMYHMLWWTGVASGTFKKVYMCPMRGRPVSEFVDGTRIIVPTTATDLKNSPRVTHEVEMDRDTLRAMQLAGVYRDIKLGEALAQPLSALTAKKATIEGKDPNVQLPEDQPYTLYECYAKLNIKGYEHKKDGKETGLGLPYRVTIDTTSREILEIRRNWDPDDDDKIFRPAQIPIVLFPFSTGLSRIYGSGLGQMMGNMASALTALTRINVDAGIFGSYPGFVKAKGPGRDLVNEITVPPGGAVEIDTGGLPIQQFLMAVPYKDASPASMALMEQLRGVAKELGGTMNIPVAEGKQDAPVGTTLAMIEQAAKPASATHKMLWAAQKEEFRLLIRLFRDDPESLWADNADPSFGNPKTEADKAARVAKFRKALESCKIEPVADPNVPSEMHRKLLALFLKQLTAGNPAYNQVEVDRYIANSVLKMASQDFDKFLLPPQQPGPTPEQLLAQIEAEKIKVQQAKVMVDAQKVQAQQEQAKADREAQSEQEAVKLALGASQKQGAGIKPPDPFRGAELGLKQQAQDLQRSKLTVDTATKDKDREAKLEVEAMKLAQAVAVHPDADAAADQQLLDASDFINGTSPGAADGGVVGSPLDAEVAKAMRLARIVEALQQERQSGYIN